MNECRRSLACLLALGMGVAAPQGSAAEDSLPREVPVVVLEKRRLQSVHIRGTCRPTGAKAAWPRPVDTLTRVPEGVRACDDEGRCVTRPRFSLACRESLSLRAESLPDRLYGRHLVVSAGDDALRFIATLDIESYVAGVVGAELGFAPDAALDAQSIVARTFAAYAILHPRHPDAPLCDLTHCQVYAGDLQRRPWRSALRTRGRILVDAAGQPGEIFFHSTCGGSTLHAHEVWPGGAPLAGSAIADVDEAGEAYCRASPSFRWHAQIADHELARALSAALDKPVDAATLTLQPLDEQGLMIEVRDHQHTHRLPAMRAKRAIGKALGWHRLKSTRFSVRRIGGMLHFVGHGLGHRVGLCQYGAIGRAHAGQGTGEILGAYFPHLKVRQRQP